MTWLIAGGIVVAGLVLLVLVLLPVRRRLVGLQRAMGHAQAGGVQAETLQVALADMQERLATLQEQAEAMAGRLPGADRSDHRAIRSPRV